MIGSSLVSVLKTCKCTQVVRGQLRVGRQQDHGHDRRSSTCRRRTGRHFAGKVVGENDFIAPLTSTKGVASKLGNGTGIVEAEFKGHYLILHLVRVRQRDQPDDDGGRQPAGAVQNDLVAEHGED